MPDQQAVELWLNILDGIFETKVFCRKIDVCSEKKNHAEIAGTSSQIIIRIYSINAPQQNEHAYKKPPVLQRTLTEQCYVISFFYSIQKQ